MYQMMFNELPTGYDCNWVEDPPEDLKCFICRLVAREPRQHPGDDVNECGKIFCDECIDFLQSQVCPHCNSDLSTFRDSNNSRRIKALMVKCDNAKVGCLWAGDLGSLDEHLKSCGCATMPCPNECKEKGVIKTCLKKNLDLHLKKECPRRVFGCPHCEESGEYCERTSTHLDTCSKLRVKCPNTPCTMKTPRCEVATHRKACKYEAVACKYKAVGCTEKPLRKDLNAHEEDAKLHLKISINQVLALSRTVAQLQEMATLQTTPIKFKLKPFQQLKETNGFFNASPFYTSQGGYKMNVTVLPCGNGSGKGTHVSVFTSLLKGVNDDDLDWPFLGRVEIQLLNQLEDKNHCIRIVNFIGNDYSKRVIEGDGGLLRLGFHEFISHGDLGYNESKNCQYLKDDKLIFIVTVMLGGSQ